VNPNETAEVVLVLRGDPHNESLDSVLDRLNTRSVGSRQYLSRGDLAELHSADPADLDAVERFASHYNLSVKGSSPAQRIVRVAGRLADFSTAFSVDLSTFRSAQGNFRAHLGPIHVPAELADRVVGVFGLDNRPLAKAHFRMRPATAARAAGGASTYTPIQVASLYDYPAGLTGQGQCIGIIEFGGGYRTNDLNQYFQDLGLPAPNVVSVAVGLGMNRPSGPNSADGEVMLDIEVAGAIAPDAQIVVYFAANDALGWVRSLSSAIHDSFHSPSVISISWGGPEQTWSRQSLRVINEQFKIAGALGITVCVAAGDNGYTDGVPGTTAYVDFPASSPYVLACGGTSLKSADGSISSETVWNDGPNFSNPNSSTGGGVSAIFALPSYQSDVGVPPSVNPPNNPGRGVPDVSGDADPNTGYRIRVDGTNMIVGGTSAVAPLWAALLTLINEQLGKPVGFVNPLLYTQGVQGGGFNDITSGSNGAYVAGPGWDPCTGLGTPNGTVLAGLL
jgi:kumamolisin